jgi:hypothetical protein
MKFKDFLNENAFDGCPITSQLLTALQKSFEKYRTKEKYKNALDTINTVNFAGSLNVTDLFFSEDDYENTVGFYAVCAKYEAMADFIKGRIHSGELRGSITSTEEAYNILKNMHKDIYWDHDGEEIVKKQIPIIFQDIKSELMSTW